MLNPTQQSLLDQLLATLSHEQRIWLAGYVNGVVGAGAAAESSGAGPLYIYYATETGNAKVVAQSLEKQAKARGFKAKSTSVSRVKPEEFKSLKDPAIFISSTHGEGDPPDMAKKFFDALKAAEGIALPDLKYAVLGLGDRSYQQFCQAAVTIDEALTKAGAKQFHPTQLLDVDYAEHTPAWIAGVLGALGSPKAAPSPASAKAAPVDGKGYSRLQPVVGIIKDSINLNDVGSNKETYHIEIGFEEGLQYHPGDAAGIIMPTEADGTAHVPRLYSIASSPLLYPTEVHLTVALSKHTLPDGTEGFGFCSRYLSQLKPGDHVQFFIQRNSRFKLPDDEKDVIMIGPGTGIAPFRAFVQERSERGSQGRNWLFFGEQHAHLDFLYQAEWQDFLSNGALTRMDVAFSRDQKQKIYVQDRIREHGQELLEWLEAGAYLYVCGRKDPMSMDVENTLLTLLEKRLSNRQAAENYLALLAEEDRYVKDVY